MKSSAIIPPSLIDLSIDAIEFFARSSALFRRVSGIGYDLRPLQGELGKLDPIWSPKIFDELQQGLMRCEVWVNFGIAQTFHPVEKTLKDLLESTPQLWPLFAVHPKSVVRAKSLAPNIAINSDFHFALLILLLDDDSAEVSNAASKAAIRLFGSGEAAAKAELEFILKTVQPILVGNNVDDINGHFLNARRVISRIEYLLLADTSQVAVEFATQTLRADYFDPLLDDLALRAASIPIRILAADIIGENISVGPRIANTPRHENIMKAFLESDTIELQLHGLNYLKANPACELNCPRLFKLLSRSTHTKVAEIAQLLLKRSNS